MTANEISQIKKKLKRGIPEGEIKNDLKSQGYSDAEISEIFKPKLYDMRSWYLGFGIIFCILGLWLFFSNGSRLLLVASAAMFVFYYFERQKIQKQRSK